MTQFDARDREDFRSALIDLSNEVFLGTARELAMGHKSSRVRIDSLWEIAETGGEKAELILCESALENSDHEARLVAVLGLAVEKGDLGEMVLWSLTKDQDDQIRLAAYVALASRNLEVEGKELLGTLADLLLSGGPTLPGAK